MKTSFKIVPGLAALALATSWPIGSPDAASYNITIDGPTSIFLAGRTDIAIPPANQAWGDSDPATADGMLRHGGTTPEEAAGGGLEKRPPSVPVIGGQVVRVLDPAVGGVNFFNGFGPPFFGPEGNPAASSLDSFGGVSGYIGTQGALAGVFLTDAIPTGSPPSTLNFSSAASRDFAQLTPMIGQIFFIGDGKNSLDQFQEFVAPLGAKWLFLGIPDGFGFGGVPGAYDDNDGSYRIVVGVDQIPTVSEVPLPAALPLFATVLAGGGLVAWRRKRKVVQRPA